MRIMYVTDALAIRGGLERVLVEKANYLSEVYGYEVFLLTANQGSHPIAFPLSGKVRHHDLGIRFHRQYKYKALRRFHVALKLHRLFTRRLDALIQTVRPDMVVSVRSELTASILKAKGNLPLIFEAHSSFYAERFVGGSLYGQFKEYCRHRSVRSADYVVALTEGDALAWKKVNRNVLVIPNVVHLNDKEVYSDCQTKSVIFVGRFSRQKGIRSLLHIWSAVHRRFPDWQLQIYGEHGEEREELLPVIEGMDARIIVNEPTPSILDKYRENSILLLTSHFEPFGLVLPEAMSCGLPVVAFDCPYGPADIITDGVDGFLVPPHDVSMFAEKVCLLMGSLALRRQMGQAGIRSSQRYRAAGIMPLWKHFLESTYTKFS